jgi:hypothetical protein
VRNCYYLFQPQSWRTTPCRLFATNLIYLQLSSMFEGCSSVRNLRTRHAVVTGIRLSLWHGPTYHGQRKKGLKNFEKCVSHHGIGTVRLQFILKCALPTNVPCDCRYWKWNFQPIQWHSVPHWLSYSPFLSTMTKSRRPVSRLKGAWGIFCLATHFVFQQPGGSGLCTE